MTLCLTFAMSIGAKTRPVPEVRPGSRDGCRAQEPTDIPAGRAADLRPAGSSGDRVARSTSATVRFAISGAMSLPVATVETVGGRDGRAARRGLRDDGDLAGRRSATRSVPRVGPARSGCRSRAPRSGWSTPMIRRSTDRWANRGELLMRGPQVFQGYWGRPADTAATLLAGGWLRTGDIASVSPDGFVTIVDRLKELIITGGFNVSPTEVEETLEAHPDVDGAAVVALPRASGGEEVAAAVVLRDGREPRRRGAARLLPHPAGGVQGAEADRRGRGPAPLAHRKGAATRGAGTDALRLSRACFGRVKPSVERWRRRRGGTYRRAIAPRGRCHTEPRRHRTGAESPRRLDPPCRNRCATPGPGPWPAGR